LPNLPAFFATSQGRAAVDQKPDDCSGAHLYLGELFLKAWWLAVSGMQKPGRESRVQEGVFEV